MANLECNAVSAVGITHMLLGRLRAKKLRGCFVYTSSAAAMIPNPFSVLYASTKAFLSCAPSPAPPCPACRPWLADVCFSGCIA